MKVWRALSCGVAICGVLYGGEALADDRNGSPAAPERARRLGHPLVNEGPLTNGLSESPVPSEPPCAGAEVHCEADTPEATCDSPATQGDSASLVGVDPVAAELILEGRRKRAEQNKKYQDKIAFIRENPTDPKREELLYSIADECIVGHITGDDATYVLNEALSDGMSHGKFEWPYLNSLVRRYLDDSRYDDAICCLRDAIRIVETRDLDFGRYESVFIDTEEDKEAVIADLMDRIRELEAKKEGVFAPPSGSMLQRSNAYPEVGRIVTRMGLSPQQQSEAGKAEAAVKAGHIDAAVELYVSLGDTENAAAALAGKAQDLEGEDRSRVESEIVRMFPETEQADLVEFSKAKGLKAEGQQDEYVRALEAYVANHPKGLKVSEAFVELAWTSLDSGSKDEGIAYLEQYLAIQIGEKHFYCGELILQLVLLYEEQGTYSKTDKLIADLIAGFDSGQLHSGAGDTKLARLGVIQSLQDLKSMVEMDRRRSPASNLPSSK